MSSELVDRAAPTAGSDDNRHRDRDGEPVDLTKAARRGAIALASLTAAMLLLGVIGRVTVFDSAIGAAEADLMDWIAQNRNDTVNAIATAGSTLSDTWTVIGVLVGAVTVLIATGNGRFATSMLAAMGLELVGFFVVGSLIDRSRPEVEALHSVPSTPSFPSGHVAAAVVIYGSLVIFTRRVPAMNRAPRGVWAASLIAVTIVGFSRVYEGVHYPTDVLGGSLLGVGALWGAAYISVAFPSPVQITIEPVASPPADDESDERGGRAVDRPVED